MDDAPINQLIVIHSLKTVYCPIPKAGCSSWKAYLRKRLDLPPLKSLGDIHDRRVNGLLYLDQLELYEVLQILHDRRRSYFKFIVCRNPYSRLYSAWNDLLKGDTPRMSGAAEFVVSTYCRAFDVRPSKAQPITFEMFVKSLAAVRPAQMNRHWQPQHIVACTNLLRYDVTLKLEEASEKADLVLNRLGADPMPFLERENVLRTEDVDLPSKYTEKMKAVVKRVYATDFRQFGYDPDVIPQT